MPPAHTYQLVVFSALRVKGSSSTPRCKSAGGGQIPPKGLIVIDISQHMLMSTVQITTCLHNKDRYSTVVAAGRQSGSCARCARLCARAFRPAPPSPPARHHRVTDHHVHRQAREGGGLVSGIELCEPDHREFDPEAARDVHWEEAGGDDDGVNLARIHGGAESTLSATSTQPGINNRGGVIIITVVFTQKGKGNGANRAGKLGKIKLGRRGISTEVGRSSRSGGCVGGR